MTPDLANDSVQWISIKVEKLIPGGKTLGRLGDGRVAMLQGALPSDRVLAKAYREKGDYVSVSDWELERASPDRVTPPCAHAARCGGCDLMALPDHRQSELKRELLQEALSRTAGLRDFANRVNWVAIDEPLHYRQRLRFQLQLGGKVGFHAKATRELVEIDKCWVGELALASPFEALRAALRVHPEVCELFSTVELRAPGLGDQRASAYFVPREQTRSHGRQTRTRSRRVASDAALPHRQATAAWTACRRVLESTLLVGVAGESDLPLQRYALPFGVELFAPLGVFTQINGPVNTRLVEDLVRGALGRGHRTFADLYAGCGNFTLPLAKSGLTGSSVEVLPEALHALSLAARKQGLTIDGIVAADAAVHIKNWARKARKFDLVVADPPRAGLTAEAQDLVAICSRHLALCSCDPVTLARDLKRLFDVGFELEELTAYDMFPQTHHLEVMAWLKAPRV